MGQDLEGEAASKAEEGAFAEAITLFQQAVEQYPQLARIHESLAQCLNEVGDCQGARSAASRATALEPEEAGGGGELGAVVAEMRETEQLWEQQVARRVGLAHLKISQHLGSSMGPGAVAWECGLCLAEYLVHEAAVLQGKRVVELGSGTGVAGITAALLGAAAVALTDLPVLLPLLDSNARRNDLGPPGVVSSALDWNAPSAKASISAHGWDFVLAADPVYAVSQVPGFVAILCRLMGEGGEGCTAFLAFKLRRPEVDSALFDAMLTAGCSWEQRGESRGDSRVKVYVVRKESG